MKDDPWIKSHSDIEPERLHAIGVVTYAWNSCQALLFIFFATLTGLPGRVTRAIIHEMSDAALIARLRDILATGGFRNDPELNAAILYALEMFDINRVNRNQLTHFMPSGKRDGKIEFWRNKGPELLRQAFPSNIDDIRRVAEDILTLRNYANNVSALAIAKQLHAHGAQIAGPLPLPDKPPLQKPLWRSQGQNHKGPKPPPGSSQG
jgi:hypothetical protein